MSMTMERRQDERDELRGREDADRAALVAAKDLDEVAGDGVQQHVEPEGSSGKRPALALRGQQEPENQQLGARFVQLGGMQRNPEGRADVGGGERIGKRNSPGLHRRLAVAAARKEAAEAPDDMPQRDAPR